MKPVSTSQQSVQKAKIIPCPNFTTKVRPSSPSKAIYQYAAFKALERRYKEETQPKDYADFRAYKMVYYNLEITDEIRCISDVIIQYNPHTAAFFCPVLFFIFFVVHMVYFHMFDCFFPFPHSVLIGNYP